MKKRINWWIVSAVLIIGIPVGFVLTGVVNKTLSKKEPMIVSASEEPKMDTVVEAEKKMETEQAETPAAESVKSVPTPAPVAESPEPVKRELTPAQIAERPPREKPRHQNPEEPRPSAEPSAEGHQPQTAEKEEAERKAEEARKAEAARLAFAKMQFQKEVEKVITSGKSSSKVPEGCVIVVNKKQTTNYQNFRNGVKLGSYSGIHVTKVEGNGVATRVYVNATVDAADD